MASSKHNARKTAAASRYGQELSKKEQRKKLAAARKKYRRNRQPRGPRRRNWMPDNLDLDQLDDWDPIDSEDGDTYTDFERIMPFDEGERRRALEQAAFTNTDVAGNEGTDSVEPSSDVPTPISAADGSNQERQQGTVMALSNSLARVEIGAQPLLCSIRGTLSVQESAFTNPIAVGDQVIVLADDAGGGVIEEVLPRRSILARLDVFLPHLRQIVVANVDQLMIVASWREPLIWFELIDRYLVAAARYDLPPVLCVNKIDLADNRNEYSVAVHPYRDLGIPILFTSAENGGGIEALRTMLRGRTTVLAGLSGVGKSTLLTVMQPGLDLRIGDISDRKHEGRHTTTQAELIRLDGDTVVVDTPGIREFGLSGLTRSELAAYFPEIAQAAGGCRFRDCSHSDEPDCAVRSALARGNIAPSRYKSYCQILADLPA